MAGARAVCVRCRVRPIDPDWRPFCSERCKLLDLAKWVDGTYRVAGETVNSAETTEGATDQAPASTPTRTAGDPASTRRSRRASGHDRGPRPRGERRHDKSRN